MESGDLGHSLWFIYLQWYIIVSPLDPNNYLYLHIYVYAIQYICIYPNNICLCFSGFLAFGGDQVWVDCLLFFFPTILAPSFPADNKKFYFIGIPD